MSRPLLYTLTSSLHGEMTPDPRQEPFIREIEAALGAAFDCRGDVFSGYGAGAPELIYIRTGGTEGLFLEKVAPHLVRALAPDRDSGVMAPGQKPVRLLASGQSNSLAAAMEILSWLRQRGIPGEILHGSPAAIAERIKAFDSGMGSRVAARDDRGNRLPGAEKGDFVPGNRKNGLPGAEKGDFVPGGRILAGKRFGVIGRPSDWLISSGVDYTAAKEHLGAELIDIPIEELVAEAQKDQGTGAQQEFVAEIPDPGAEKGQKRCDPQARTLGLDQKTPFSVPANGPKMPAIDLKPLNSPKYGRKIDADDWHGALAIYDALKALVARYQLDGLTLRCFDLLTALHNTGCLALAMLNAEGITATCEGDIPAMLSMAVARALTGRSSFQVNLSRIDGDRLLFAHCTVPLDIVRDYCYDTHFESGIGVAIHGELPPGPVTLLKISPDFRRIFRREATLVANPYDDCLCRTQVVVEAPGAAAYFLQEPIGNHHIIVPGKL